MYQKFVLKDVYLFNSQNNTLISDKYTAIDLSNFDKGIIQSAIDFFKEPQYIYEFLDGKSEQKKCLLLVNTLIHYGMLSREIKHPILQNKVCIVSYKRYNSHFNKLLEYTGIKSIEFCNVDENTDFYISDNTTTILFIPNNPKLLIDILLSYKNYNIQDLLFGNIYMDEIWTSYLDSPVTSCPSCLGMRLYQNLSTFKYAVDNNLTYEDEISALIAIDFICKSIQELTTHVNLNLNPSICGYLNIINISKMSIDNQLVVREANCNCFKKKVDTNELIGDHVGLIRTIGQVQLAQSDPPVVLLSSNTKSLKSMDSGALDSDLDICKIRAINEYLERYSWDNYNEDVIRSSWTGLDKEKIIDINKFNIYSEEQYLNKAIQYKKLYKDDVIDWVLMKNTKNSEEKYVPAELVLGTKLQSIANLTVRSSTGVAAGPTKEFALSKSILELIERDSITRNILFKKDIFKLESNLLINSDMCNKCLNYNLLPEIYVMDNKYKVPVIMCKLIPFDNEDIIISYGYSCELDLFFAVEKAVKESLLMRINIRNNINEKGLIPNLGAIYYNIRNNNKSFFNELNVINVYDLNILKDKIVDNINLTEFEDIYYKDITLSDVKCSDTYVITSWSPNMIDLVCHREYAPLGILDCDIQDLNKGYIPF